MLYTSTRDNNVRVESAQAIAQGISEDGGLFVPVSVPKLSEESILSLVNADYITRAAEILSMYLSDFSKEELYRYAQGAYGNHKFGDGSVVPLAEIEANLHMLELWHGPTCAFKDMALQMLPYLLTASVKKTGDNKKVVILVATSGDTGKAALEGFKNVEGTEIIVFYPEDGVSPMQKLQMTTQEGSNVFVSAIRGNFDDAQTGVKAIFTDQSIKKKLEENGMMFSSANSINWGRLVPQIVYYISAYCDMIADGSIKPGQKINIVVPTGNFGNILAAYYAKEMGLPVNKLVCASNANNVLTDFIKTGVYNKNRDFYTTISPSMDILVSSNLERLLYHLSGGNDGLIREWMTQLGRNGGYQIPAEMLERIEEIFDAGYCDDAETKSTINEVWKSKNYLCDTHTAVGLNVYRQYRERTGDESDTVIASTASPYKFSKSVLSAIKGEDAESGDEFEMVKELSVMTSAPVPAQIEALSEKEPVFTDSCERDKMSDVVLKRLGIN